MVNSRSAFKAMWTLLLAAFLAVGVTACGQPAEADESTQASGSAQTQPEGLYGSPWITSIFIGNLPEEAPKATDDLYLHYSYDYATQHQDGYASVLSDNANELKTTMTSMIKGASAESDELDQLRIFYDQAADIDSLEAAGAGELKPYLKAIADTKSLDELETLLLSPDFPFSPWIKASVSAPNMKASMCTQVMPNMLFADESTGADVYKDTDDPAVASAYELMRAGKTAQAQTSLMLVSIVEDTEQAIEATNEYFKLEKSYGKDCIPSADGLEADYGVHAQQMKLLTADELAAACPNFPMIETLAKLGKDGGDGFIITYPAWLESFNSVWTEDNFELLRGMTEAKVLGECAPFLAPSYYAGARQRAGLPEPTADEFAYAACDKSNTFSQLLAKTFVEQELGDQAFDDLTKLSNDLIDAYIELVDQTDWLNEQTRENVIDKIDNMALNILYPDGGYFDYSGLKLTPTEEGGTLLGNYLAVKAYNNEQEAALIGKPAVASTMWLQQAPTLQNCVYDAVSNSINVFPGYVMSNMYRKDMSREELLGGIGFTVAHEISHAFDYNGSQFNAYGEPTAIFADDDVLEYVDRCHQLADRYSAIEVTPGVNVDGSFTIVESMADLCGLQATLTHAELAGDVDAEKLFEQFAYKRASVYPSYYSDLLRLDPHPLENLRVNVSAQMCDGYYDTFGAAEGDTMYLAPDERITIWGE